MEISVKKSEIKVDPKDPKSDPTYKYAEAKATQIMKRDGIKYGEVNEEKGFSESYWHRVKNNPNNIAGAPAFYPPIHIRSSFGGIRPARQCACGGCSSAREGFICPRCSQYVPDKDETTNQ